MEMQTVMRNRGLSWYGTALLAALTMATAAHAADGLKVGDSGPAIEVKEYIQGEAPERGKPYVVEFWATWCGPCKKSIPHLNELYKKFRPMGLSIVGISDETPQKVKSFVKRQGDNMSYPIAIDGGVQQQWFKAAGLRGIPAAFVVNADNKIMWIGNPLDPQFGKIVEAVTKGRYNPVLAKRAAPKLSAAERAAKLRNFKQAYDHMDEVIALDNKVFIDVAMDQYTMKLNQEKDPQAAGEYAEKLILMYRKDAGALQMIAIMLAADPDHDTHDMKRARDAADFLITLEGPRSVLALQTSAEVAYHAGDKDRAVSEQKRAWMFAKPHMKPLLKTDLDKYLSSKKRSSSR